MKRTIPWSYPLRNLAVRWPAAVFSAVGIAMTVAVLCGVFALRRGFESIMSVTGRDDVIVYLRVGATSEGESGIPLERVEQYKKERSEVALDEMGRPLAAGETYLALYLEKNDGGNVNVPIRGVEDMSFAIQGDRLRIVEGRRFTPGSDEVIVGVPLTERVKGAQLGKTLVVNLTPFRVVGTFEHDGAYRSEIWGDVDRIAAALERAVRQRVVARLRPGTDVDAVRTELEEHKTLPSKVYTERGYFESQGTGLTTVLGVLGIMLTSILSIAAVLGAANTMLAAIGARTREIGILRSMGFPSIAVLATFLFEAAVIGLAGGVLGALIVLPLDGLQTGTMNWNTFTEQAFAFRVDLPLLLTAVGIAVALGLLGGLAPAWKASRLPPVEALRRL